MSEKEKWEKTQAQILCDTFEGMKVVSAEVRSGTQGMACHGRGQRGRRIFEATALSGPRRRGRSMAAVALYNYGA